MAGPGAIVGTVVAGTIVIAIVTATATAMPTAIVTGVGGTLVTGRLVTVAAEGGEGDTATETPGEGPVIAAAGVEGMAEILDGERPLFGNHVGHGFPILDINTIFPHLAA